MARICSRASSGIGSPSSFSASASHTQSWRQVLARSRAEKMVIISCEAYLVLRGV